ncbi:biliverdin-producing heme oxygenase [Microbacterium sp. STN6]|uniref:biliverdin-producing heme oxygenase n=1 Tax=Microbacterium sp. STN6 TaxID=2995588 RepID=UPI002260F512|nr:biliverdin-producing heme oxygenase [Microbacterium sp. STN6]MCX7522500.1 biliverdin-producing heme oxygenase [Microbacterium sp. STN6]
MSVVIPFSQAVRERTQAVHTETEGSAFIGELLGGKRSREDYIALVAQQYFVYEALEAVALTMANDPVASVFASPALTRVPAIEADLEFLIGADWRDSVTPLAATSRYVARIREMANWAGGFVAHHYTRYLGDLSGGQIIRTLMQRQFGFETNGVGFYVFDQIAKPKAFKETYRAQLDAVAWEDEERERVIAEVARAFRHNAEMFDDLARATETTAA